jgi:hypothetical protein
LRRQAAQRRRALLFELLCQLFYFNICCFTLPFDFFALGNITKHDDGAVWFSILHDGRARVLNRDCRTVGMPEHLIVNPMHFAVRQCRVHRALRTWVGRAVGMRMMMNFVGLSSQDFINLPTQNLVSRRIAEGCVAFCVESVNPLPGRIQIYPKWQEYLREYQPPTLIVWGKNDEIFPAAGAEPYKRDLTDLEYYLIDTGHFALETHGQEIADLMRDFLNRKVDSSSLAAN